MTNKQTIGGLSRDAILWLLKHNPVLCQKSGLDTPELRALLDAPVEPMPSCIGDLERFESDGEDFVKVGDVIDMLGNLKAAQPQGDVERLAERLGEENAQYRTLINESEAKAESFSVQLAEQNALIREVADQCNIGFNMRERLLAALSTSAEPEPRGKLVLISREQFEAWVFGREHPVYGWLDQYWFSRGDDPENYAEPYVQGLWVASQTLYAEQPAPSHSGDANEMVAKVVLPERYSLEMFQVISGLVSITSEQFDLVWGACRAEAARLNGIKP